MRDIIKHTSSESRSETRVRLLFPTAPLQMARLRKHVVHTTLENIVKRIDIEDDIYTGVYKRRYWFTKSALKTNRITYYDILSRFVAVPTSVEGRHRRSFKGGSRRELSRPVVRIRVQSRRQEDQRHHVSTGQEYRMRRTWHNSVTRGDKERRRERCRTQAQRVQSDRAV